MRVGRNGNRSPNGEVSWSVRRSPRLGIVISRTGQGAIRGSPTSFGCSPPHDRNRLGMLLGRACLDLPAEVQLSEIKVAVLRQNRIKSPANLGDEVRLVARLGGYLGRKNDPLPGHQLIWRVMRPRKCSAGVLLSGRGIQFEPLTGNGQG